MSTVNIAEAREVVEQFAGTDADPDATYEDLLALARQAITYLPPLLGEVERRRGGDQLPAANQARTIAAAIIEDERVRTAMRQLDGNAPHHLLAAAQLRLDHPRASYTELATKSGLTKNQVSTRIRRFLQLAERQRAAT